MSNTISQMESERRQHATDRYYRAHAEWKQVLGEMASAAARKVATEIPESKMLNPEDLKD